MSGLENAVSLERLGRYFAWADNDHTRALELYAINTAVSEAFYTPLQMMEVALRNRCHAVLSEQFGPYWFDLPGILTSEQQIRSVLDTKVDLIKGMAKKERATTAVLDRLTPGRIVASLTFGFWTAFFGTNYENTLWRQCLYKVTTNPPPKMKRAKLSVELTAIRLLRNRIAHHEPILYYDLAGRHERILEVTDWLIPIAARWTERHSRLPEIYAQHESCICGVRRIHDDQKKERGRRDQASVRPPQSCLTQAP
jgi:hypothetical protein